MCLPLLSRASDCNAICHPRCIPNLPANCGLPSDYSRYMIDAMAYIRPPTSSSTAEKTVVPSAPAVQLQLSGFLKVPRLVVDSAVAVLIDVVPLINISHRTAFRQHCTCEPVLLGYTCCTWLYLLLCLTFTHTNCVASSFVVAKVLT